MSSNKLPNYLRTFRKRAGFSQGEVAFLLGVRNGSKVNRYERFTRTPNCKTALAFQILFQTTAKALFGGICQKIEREMSARIALMNRRLAFSKQTRLTSRKQEFLRALTNSINQ